MVKRLSMLGKKSMVNGNINWVMVLMLLKEWFYIMVSIMQLIMMDIWLQMVRPMLATTM